MEQNQPVRALSHDEQKAAEAAFAGRPFNPNWSARAKEVYEGIINALPSPPERIADDSSKVESEGTPVEAIASEPLTQPEASTGDEAENITDRSRTLQTKIPFEQALASGALIDVSSTAKELGFSFPVTVTKPLWDVGIAPAQIVNQEEQADRLRDVLMAFRLRLVAQPSVSPLIDFPALLAFPPNTVPQPLPLFALIQPDEQNRAMVTLLLPNEVAATIIPMN